MSKLWRRLLAWFHLDRPVSEPEVDEQEETEDAEVGGQRPTHQGAAVPGRPADYTRRQALKALSSYLGAGTQCMAFARILYPDHEVRYAAFFVGGGYLALVPVQLQHLGRRNRRLYRHDEVRLVPLAAARIRTLDLREFRTAHYGRRRPYHDPGFTEEYYLVGLNAGVREYRIFLRFLVDDFESQLIDILNAAPDASQLPEVLQKCLIDAGDPLLSAWHMPRRDSR